MNTHGHIHPRSLSLTLNHTRISMIILHANRRSDSNIDFAKANGKDYGISGAQNGAKWRTDGLLNGVVGVKNRRYHKYAIRCKLK